MSFGGGLALPSRSGGLLDPLEVFMRRLGAQHHCACFTSEHWWTP